MSPNLPPGTTQADVDRAAPGDVVEIRCAECKRPLKEVGEDTLTYREACEYEAFGELTDGDCEANGCRAEPPAELQVWRHRGSKTAHPQVDPREPYARCGVWTGLAMLRKAEMWEVGSHLPPSNCCKSCERLLVKDGLLAPLPARRSA